MNFERVPSLLRVNVTYERRKVRKRFEKQTRCKCCWILGMAFQVSIGFSALDNSDGKTDQSKICALFIGDTVLVNEVKEYDENWAFLWTNVIVKNEPCTLYTSSKKDINHIAIILNDDASDDDEVDEKPAITPRRAAATTTTTTATATTTTTTNKNRVNIVVSIGSASLFVFRMIQLHLKNHAKSIRKSYCVNWMKKQKLDSHPKMIEFHQKSNPQQRDNHSLYSIQSRARKVNNSYRAEGQIPRDPEIQDLKLYIGLLENLDQSILINDFHL